MTVAATSPVPQRTSRRRRLVIWIAVAAVGLLSIAGAWWLAIVFIFFNFHEVGPGVYRSSQPSLQFLQRMIHEKNLRSIIKLNNSRESSWSAGEGAIVRAAGVQYFDVPIGVTELPARYDLIAIIDALESAQRPLLIHCKTGADRTGFVAALVQMHDGKRLDEAISDQLRLGYLHIGHIGPEIGDVFVQYRQDRG